MTHVAVSVRRNMSNFSNSEHEQSFQTPWSLLLVAVELARFHSLVPYIGHGWALIPEGNNGN